MKHVQNSYKFSKWLRVQISELYNLYEFRFRIDKLDFILQESKGPITSCYDYENVHLGFEYQASTHLTVKKQSRGVFTLPSDSCETVCRLEHINCVLHKLQTFIKYKVNVSYSLPVNHNCKFPITRHHNSRHPTRW